MKALKSMLFAIMIAASMLIPTQSRAGGLDGLLEWLFGSGGNQNQQGGQNGQGGQGGQGQQGQGTGAPIDGQLVFLLLAGAGLGVKMIYDYRKKEAEITSI